jgi:hypothetical protein
VLTSSHCVSLVGPFTTPPEDINLDHKKNHYILDMRDEEYPDSAGGRPSDVVATFVVPADITLPRSFYYVHF